MRENALQEVSVFLRDKYNRIPKQVLEIYKVSDVGNLQNKMDIEKIPEESGCSKIAELYRDGTLFLTDCSNTAEILAKKGIPVLGILTEANRQESFHGVQYLCEGTESLEPEYLERIYRRYHKLPWKIAETRRCLIRETTEEDVDAFYRIYAEPMVTAYMEDLFTDRDEEIHYIRQYRKSMYEFCDFGIWTVLEKKTGEVIGRAGFALREGYEEPELGFLVGVPWQGKGLATEVCEAVLRYGAEELEFKKVQALAEPENEASIKLLQKLGFVDIGECEDKGKTYRQFLKEL